MKKNENEVRKIMLKVRMNENELQQVKKHQQKSRNTLMLRIII